LGLRAQRSRSGASLKAFGGLNRDSNSEYPENIPSRIERSEVRESPRVEGGCTGATASWHPPLRRSRQNKRSPDRDLMVIRGHDQAVLYDVDLHVVSALFRLREGADRGSTCGSGAIGPASSGCRSTRAQSLRRSSTACRSGASGTLNARNRTRLGQRPRIHVLLYLVEHDPQT